MSDEFAAISHVAISQKRYNLAPKLQWI